MKGSDEEKALLAAYGLAESHVVSLRALAARVRQTGAAAATPGKKVSQRALDLQDGRVLLLIDKIQRAFRVANRIDRSILVPQLNKIAWMFETRSSRPKAPVLSTEADGSGSPTGL